MTLLDKLNQLLSRDGVRSLLYDAVENEVFNTRSEWMRYRSGLHSDLNETEPVHLIDAAYVTKLESTIRALIPVVAAVEKIAYDCPIVPNPLKYEHVAQNALVELSKALATIQNLESAVGK